MNLPWPSTLLRSPTLWIAAGVAARHAVGAWQLRRTLAFLAQTPPPEKPRETRGAIPRIHFVVPALHEQAHIAAAVPWFAALLGDLPGSTLTVVTTAREERERAHLLDLLAAPGPITARRFPQLGDAEIRSLAAAQAGAAGRVLSRPAAAAVLHRLPLTGKVVADQLADPDLAGAAIRHVVYPGQGRKAAQVNYAVTQLDAGEHDYVAVYDVDSRPDPALLRHTLAVIEDRQYIDGEPPAVVQQSARFATAGTATRGWERAACRGSARLQTLWTLRRELPSFRRYARTTRRTTGQAALDAVARGLAQTVGHGLLVRRDILGRLGGLPEFTVLDDLPFGYRLTIEAIPVDVVAATTTVPAPEHIADLVAMHRRWFHNYLDYPACAAAARAGGHGTPTGRGVALAVAGYRAATWVLAGPATLAATAALLGPHTPTPVRIVAAAGLWLGCVTPVRMLAAADGQRPTPTELARDSAEVYAGYLLKSIGPLTALAAAAVPRRRAERFSPKTQRRHLPPVKERS